MDLSKNFDRKYDSFKEDPIFACTLLNKYVKVESIKEVTFKGYLLAIDPESYSIVLAVINEENVYKNVMVPGHAILNIVEDKLPEHLKPLVTLSCTTTAKDVTERKLKLISWLKMNLLPVSEVDENIVLGNAYILPPYSTLDICAENPIVVNQVKNMISKMPDDFKCS